jgi:effector-binding domain-containing protein
MQLYFFSLIFLKYFLFSHISVKKSKNCDPLINQSHFYSGLSSVQNISSASISELPVGKYTNAKHIFNFIKSNSNPKTIFL